MYIVCIVCVCVCVSSMDMYKVYKACIYMCLSIYICVCVCVCMKKAEKQNNPNRRIYCDVKLTLNVSRSITFIRTLISGELFTQRWMLIEITEANKMYTTKRYKCVHSVLNLKVLSTCLARGIIFENVFFKRQEILLISKSWWRLLKAKRLTLTLHHNKFSYLDYFVFLLSSYSWI